MNLKWRQWLAIAIALGLVILAWVLRRPLLDSLDNIQAARAWLQSLGPLGPLVLILTNAVQIVVAPIPGYFVQAAAGWVFGMWAGALYGTLGLLVGGTLAATLTRVLGRPFAARIIGAARLQRWQETARSDSPWLWTVLLLGPVGDIPYFLAGLSRFPIPRLMLIALLVRGPSVLLASAVGAGVVDLSPELLLALFLGLILLLALFYLFGARLQQRAEQWFFGLLRRLQS